MDRKTALFVATIGSVAVIVSLALTVTLWPEKQKVENKSNSGAGSSSATAQGSSAMATAQALKKPAPASAPSSLGMTDLSGANVAGAPIIKQEIGQALIRDPETGKMKEVPYTAQVLIMTGPDGKPLQVKDAKVQGFVAATESPNGGSTPPGGRPLGGTASRPK